ncbi:hypothetical protein [Nocardia africana]|uniref:Uncharacterized protein n=1 Tax=Nocardia africana TaxID=134964 RepID=A0A378X245_9NOCA|nr:hypothetical protein [Nocardia africana]MCC3316799.1 hypothetical protein [Nocardia africana]SUA47519.1 Uncharacterised protein [Nocardia africana]
MSADVRQQWLFERLVDEVCSNAPTEYWYDMNVTYVAAGSSVKMRTEVHLQGKEEVLDRPLGFADIPQQQRALMYKPGQGTWFTQHLVINSNGDSFTEYGYEEPECFPFSRADLEDDLRLYPRESVPQWITERSIQDPESNSTGSGQFLLLPSPAAARSDKELLGRTKAKAALASAVAGATSEPRDDDWWCFKVELDPRRHDGLRTVYCQALTDYYQGLTNGYERRRAEIYVDGRIVLIDSSISVSQTRIPALDQLLDAPDSAEILLTLEQFRKAWIGLGGQWEPRQSGLAAALEAVRRKITPRLR